MYVILLNPDTNTHLLIIEKLCKSIIYLPQIKLIYGKYERMALYENDKLITDEGNNIYDWFKLPESVEISPAENSFYNNSLLSTLNKYQRNGKSASDAIAAEQELDKLELSAIEGPSPRDIADRFSRDSLY